jgi:anti-sigma28 factor (negative regulator of flagellin synthesis)
VASAPGVLTRDEAAVSSFAAKLADRQKALDGEEAAKVEQLRGDYQRDGYTVDSAKVSHAIVNACLSLGSALA